MLAVIAFAAALLAGGIFIAIMGANPFSAYWHIIKGALGSIKKIRAMTTIFVPLVVVSLALSLAFKMKFWNIGGNGQILIGAAFASFFAINFKGLPHVLLLVIMFLAAAVGGALTALIPALFKVRFGTNETLFTLMLNYIAYYFVLYLQSGPWARQGHNSIAQFDKNTYLDSVGGVNCGWIFAVLLIAAVFVYLYHSKQGYEISVVGESQATARYAGMNVSWIIIRTMLLSGALCGIAGMIQIAGSDYTLSCETANNMGFTGITVAWLANLNPFIIGVVSMLFSLLQKGSIPMQTATGLSSYTADVLQAIILFIFLGFEFFNRYSLVFRSSKNKTAAKESEASK